MKACPEPYQEARCGTVPPWYTPPVTPLLIVSSYLTVKEAARLTGRSPSSIRRVIYPILENDAHPDRGHIRPDVEEVKRLRMNGENFAWRLSEDLLRREIPVESPPEKGSPHATKFATGGQEELLAMLRRELDIKNQQITQQSELIAKQMELVSGLSERLREGNILIASLQQRLSLGEASGPHPSPVTAKSAAHTPPEKAARPTSKTGKPKKGLLSRLFRR